MIGDYNASTRQAPQTLRRANVVQLWAVAPSGHQCRSLVHAMDAMPRHDGDFYVVESLFDSVWWWCARIFYA